MPLVSVIIPNYNHARFLRRRIESVLRQTFQDFEVILLDDCSTDNSKSIICKYSDDPRIRIEFNEKNSGSTFKQWNKGVRLAQGEYIWIAESDDYSDPQFLRRLVGVLGSEPEAVFAYCRSWRVSEDDALEGFGDFYLDYFQTPHWTSDFLVDGREECKKYFVFSNIVPNASAVLFRRAVYNNVGGADERFRLNGDWKLWASMALTGKIAYVGDPLNYYRFHDQSVRGRDKLLDVAAEEIIWIMDWLANQLSLSPRDNEKIRQFVSNVWTKAIVNKGLPIRRKWSILQNARNVDPAASRRLVGALFQRFIKDNVRIYLWHPVLDATRTVRHAIGLRQRHKSV